MVLPPALPVPGMGKMREDVFIETSSSNQSRRGFLVLNYLEFSYPCLEMVILRTFNNINERIKI